MYAPVVKEIQYINPFCVFSIFKDCENAVFLDSAECRENCGQYSYIAFDPVKLIRSKDDKVFVNKALLETSNPFDCLAEELKTFSQIHVPELPPFQGGLIGYFGYDLSRHLEKLPRHKQDDMQFPDMMVGIYDVVIAFDHAIQKAWIISTGYPYLDDNCRFEKAKKKIALISSLLNNIPDKISTSHAFCLPNSICSNFDKLSYELSVKKVVDYILSGDIFEANISQRFKTMLPHNLSAFDLYARLRQINPAPFAAYLHFDEVCIASASPERFIRLDQKQVETRPIKGTRPRGKTSEEDGLLSEALLNSAKDHAENVMIVDLMRNDISRVCKQHTVNVPKLCGLESYSTVHHLVSVVTGELKSEFSALDLLKATFPGGSITGAPKMRSMEIIAEIEPTDRGPYCGSIGFIGFNGNMDTSITIRTFCIKKNMVTFQVGGAVVADSDPTEEYQETLTKALSLLKALTGDAHDYFNR